ncbi:MAG: hypothetical protein ACRDPA_23995 [Solirubrobacteraceae bacterium]
MISVRGGLWRFENHYEDGPGWWVRGCERLPGGGWRDHELPGGEVVEGR